MQNNQNVCVEEDEIDLRELFATIWKHKIFIFIFVSVVTILTIIYALSKPNQYTIQTILAPQEQSKSSLGGLGALASMAGVNVGGASGVTPDVAFTTLLNNYAFMKQFIIKYKLDKKLANPNEKNYIFALNNDSVYKFFHSEKKKLNNQKISLFSIYSGLKGMIKISTDKKTGLITVSVLSPDRKLGLYILNSFLAEATKYLNTKNLADINSKIDRYQTELIKTQNLELKTELANLISNLIKQRVYINSSKYYKVRVVSDPYIPDVKAKTKPKRGLIVIVAFITSFILAIFLVFFIEFIRGDKKED